MTQEKFYIFLRESCFFFGFFSIAASLFFWFQPVELDLNKINQNDIAIFIGLWSPTFFILSVIFNKMVDKVRNKNK
jgi:hypothetical protein